MKKILTFVFLLKLTMMSSQQSWYFGNHGGITFDLTQPFCPSNPPPGYTGPINPGNSGSSVIDTYEGSAEVVDKNNKVIMYTDGRTIWNGAHQSQVTLTGGWSTAQYNGLNSSTHAALICPIPGTNNQDYFIFTVTDGVISAGVTSGQYANTSGGYGPLRVTKAHVTGTAPNCVITVAAGEKNVQLSPGNVKIGEKLALTKDDACGYWLTTHGVGVYGGNYAQTINNAGEKNFYTYHINATNSSISGLSNSSVVSTFQTGSHQAFHYTYPDINNPSINYPYTPSHQTTCVGQMKFSPDGSKLGCVVGNSYAFQLYNFNKSTGVISVQKIISGFGPAGPKLLCGNGMPYGLEFSPNSKYVYISTNFVSIGSNGIYQYNATLTNTASILNSGSLLNAVDNQDSPFGGIQLGPDSNIYVANDQFTSVWTYTTPNVPPAGAYHPTYGSNQGSWYFTDPTNATGLKLGLPTVLKVKDAPILSGTITTAPSTVCAGYSITVTGANSAGNNVPTQSHCWIMEECDQYGNATSGGYTSGYLCYAGDPGTITFPGSNSLPCNKYYRIKLALYNTDNCLEWIEAPVKIIYVACNPTPSILTENDMCLGSSMNMCVNSTYQVPSSTYSLTWGPKKNNLNCITVSPTAEGTYQYSVTVTNTITGCKGQAITYLNVYNNNAEFNISINSGFSGYKEIDVITSYPSIASAPGFMEEWIANEVDPNNYSVISSSGSFGCWQVFPSTNYFQGLNALNSPIATNCSTGPTHGQFSKTKTYTIVHRVKNDFCGWATKTVTVTPQTLKMGNINTTSSNLSKENSNSEILNIYPNPSNSLLNIKLENAQDILYTIEVFDIFGKLVYKNEQTNTQGSEFKTEINLTDLNLSNGLYLVNVNSGYQKSSQRIVIEK